MSYSPIVTRPLRSLKLGRGTVVPSGTQWYHGTGSEIIGDIVPALGPGLAAAPRRGENISVAPKIFSREGSEKY